jgi:hypothetical protein
MGQIFLKALFPTLTTRGEITDNERPGFQNYKSDYGGIY